MEIIEYDVMFMKSSQVNDCTGNWVAESDYLYNIIPDENEKDSICIFQIIAKLHLEFNNGGSMEFHYQLLYALVGFETKPALSDLVSLAEKTSFKLNQYFSTQPFMRNNINCWINHDKDLIYELVGKKLIEIYPQ